MVRNCRRAQMVGAEIRPDFFARPAARVARELLGKVLVRSCGHGEICGVVTETEAYEGPRDRACHSSRGRTKRTEIMFGPAGRFYIYRIYGLHWMLNIVTGAPGDAAAVLIRALDTVRGPARLTAMLEVDQSFNGKPANRQTGLWFEDRGNEVSSRDVKRTARIGVEYAGPYWSKKKLRFVLAARKATTANSELDHPTIGGKED
jgi:DNA-3-methyladenine glycosylase